MNAADLARLGDEELAAAVNAKDPAAFEALYDRHGGAAFSLGRETASELRTALDALPEEQSKVIELAYFGGFSHREIAEIVGQPLGTVKGRMRLGLEKIRVEIAEAIAPEALEGGS